LTFFDAKVYFLKSDKVCGALLQNKRRTQKQQRKKIEVNRLKR